MRVAIRTLLLLACHCVSVLGHPGGQQKKRLRRRRLNIGDSCTADGPSCGMGNECACEGRRLFGAPSAAPACTCQAIPSPPSPSSPPPLPPFSPPPPPASPGPVFEMTETLSLTAQSGCSNCAYSAEGNAADLPRGTDPYTIEVFSRTSPPLLLSIPSRRVLRVFARPTIAFSHPQSLPMIFRVRCSSASLLCPRLRSWESWDGGAAGGRGRPTTFASLPGRAAGWLTTGGIQTTLTWAACRP